MAKRKDCENIYKFVEDWKENCLIGDGSLLWGGDLFKDREKIWTDKNIEAFRQAFVGDINKSGKDFWLRFEKQLERGARRLEGEKEKEELYKLTSEIVLMLYPFRSDATLETKKANIKKILLWKGIKLDKIEEERLGLLGDGIGRAGTASSILGHIEILFIFCIAEKIKEKTQDDRRKIFSHHLNFRKFLKEEAVKVEVSKEEDLLKDQRTLERRKIPGYNILLHLLYPDYYEPIAGHSQKDSVIRAFSHLLDSEDDGKDSDDKIFKIRKKLEREYPNENLDFFESPLKEQWQSGDSKKAKQKSSGKKEQKIEAISADGESDNTNTYQVSNIMDDGCFMEEGEVQKILDRLEDKKNIILQGPPGTGKTWLAKRLAYALIGRKDKERICAMQFHPTLSYEDFVRGYRPNEEERLSLEDGPFMKMIEKAREDKDKRNRYVFVIEEINRGNPAQIFGEMLTLLEPDKRGEEITLNLAFGDKPVWIPNNFYVIGTMNLADRSLAMMDFALRRRFAFIDLEPQLNDKWLDWMKKRNNGIDETKLRKIQTRVNSLNDTIANAEQLGAQYKIGHSFFTGRIKTNIRDWFESIVETEIYPLLKEYWFEDTKKAEEEKKKLLEGF